jgi:hypothetical protein
MARLPKVRLLLPVVLATAGACVRLAPKIEALPPAAVPERFVLCAQVTRTADWADLSLVGDAFVRDRDPAVCAVVDFRALRGAHRLTWKWYDPSGSLARISDPVAAGEEGFEYDRFLAWDEFPVTAETPIGRWTVALFVDDRFAGAKEFEMTAEGGGLQPRVGMRRTWPMRISVPLKLLILCRVETDVP